MEHSYRFCGFILSSDQPLPGLKATSRITDTPNNLITVHLNAVSGEYPEPSEWFMRQDAPDGYPWSARAKTPEGYFLRFPELADFLIDSRGHDVSCVARHPESYDHTIRALLIDHVLPAVIALRGRYVLHAAAVRTTAGVCIFAGYSGAGKSTIAAQLATVGNDFLTDDCLVLEEQGDRIVATGSHPSLKLCDDAIAFLRPGCAGESVADYTSKRRLPLTSLGATRTLEPLPVARLYFLTRGDDDEAVAISEPLIRRLSARDTFFRLVKHSIRLDSVNRTMLEREFQFTRRMVNAVPAALLALPNDLGRLPLAHDAIAADLLAG
jgi:hypothetical protein